MRTINLQPLIDSIAGPVATTASFEAEARAGYDASFRREGAQLVAPAPVRATYDGTKWNITPQLEQLPAGHHWRIRIQVGSYRVPDLHAVLPAGTDAIAYADLIPVDPATGVASDETIAQWTATLDRVTQLAASTERDRLNALHHATRAIAANADAQVAARDAEAARDAALAASLGAGLGFERTFAAAASWTVPIPPAMTRRPAVQLYLADGCPVFADVEVDMVARTVTAIFAMPTAGSVVLT